MTATAAHPPRRMSPTGMHLHAPIMVERAGGNAAFASQLLLASYAASVLTIPAAVWLFGRWAGV